MARFESTALGWTDLERGFDEIVSQLEEPESDSFDSCNFGRERCRWMV